MVATRLRCAKCGKPFTDRSRSPSKRCWPCRSKGKMRCFICGVPVKACNAASALCEKHKQELKEIKAARHANDFPQQEEVPSIRLYRVSEIFPQLR